MNKPHADMRSAYLWFVAAAVLFIVLRAPNLAAPFVNLLDTGFQESIALHHLDGGWKDNRLLPVISIVNGERVFHTAHPPLLHLVYAALYAILGVHTWISRVVSLLAYLITIWFWFRYLLDDEPKAYLFFPLALFIPLPFALSLTTNYEPFSLLAITAIVVAFTRYREMPSRKSLTLFIIVLLPGLLVDWPVYLAIPTLLVLNFQHTRSPRVLAALFVFQFIFFLSLLGYQKLAAGEIVFFGHAATRSNPLALWSADTYVMLYAHLKDLMGKGPLLLMPVFGIAWIIQWYKEGPRPVKLKGLHFFALFPLVLLLSAPQLLARHYVHLFYLVPLCVLLIYGVIRDSEKPLMLLAVVMLLCAPYDFMHAITRNYRYQYIAQSNVARDVETTFSSAAVGNLKFANRNIETLYPVSPSAAELFSNAEFEMVLMDRNNPEVAYVSQAFEERKDDYARWLSFPGEQIYIRKEVSSDARYLAAELDWNAGRDWKQPEATVIPVRDSLAYAIRQHPTSEGSLPVRVPVEPGSWVVNFSLAIHHAWPFKRPSDGVEFIMYLDEKPNRLLLFEHYLDDPSGKGNLSHEFDVEFTNRQPAQLLLFTGPGPRSNMSYDDAYWVEAMISPAEKK